MTRLETERLVRRIRSVLRGDADHVLGAKSAEDYAAVSRTVQLRLQQCETMIQAGNPRQAIQLAEASPDLLNLVTLISFAESDQWRELCTDQRWPAFERIDERAVRRLNECYAGRITKDDALYRDYRRAMLKRNERTALAVLKTIARFSPDDEDTQNELVRLDAKVLKLNLAALEKCLTDNDEQRVVRQAVQIEEFGFLSKPAGAVWKKAQLVRCSALLTTLEGLQTANRWQDGTDLLEQVQNIIAGDKLKPPAEAAKRLKAASHWIAIEQKKAENAGELFSLIAKLKQMLRESAERDLDGPKGSPNEWEAEHQELKRLWHDIELHGNSPPKELRSGYEQRCASLKRALVWHKRKRFRGLAFATLALAAILIVSVWLWFGNSRSREYSAQIKELQKQRQVRAVATLLDRIRSEEGKMMVSPALRAAMAQADQFVIQEQSALKGYEQVFAALPGEFIGLSNSTLIAHSASTLWQATNLFSALAPDLQIERLPSLQGFAYRWAAFIKARSATLTAQFEAALVEVETVNARLESQQDLAVARVVHQQFTGLLKQLEDFVALSSAGVPFHSGLRARLNRCLANADSWSAALGEHDAIGASLPKVQSQSAYDLAIRNLSKSPLTNSPYVLAVNNLARFKFTDEFILQSLLLPSNSISIQFLKRNPTPTFIARQVLPAERLLLKELATSPSMRPELRRYRFKQVPGGRVFSWITVGSLPPNVGRSSIPAFCPEELARTFLLVSREFDSYGGHLRVATGELSIPSSGLLTVKSGATVDSTLVAIEAAEPCSETSVLSTEWRASLLDPQIAQHSLCLLRVLEELRDSHAGSPLFRAFLFVQLAHLAESQPEEWGVAFAPSVGRHRAELEKLAITWGDWFLPAREATLGKSALEALDKLPKYSYHQQAQSIAAIASEVLKAGLAYVGYVGLDGNPVLLRESANTELIGMAMDSGRPIVVRRVAAGQKPTGQQRLQPLCPLFELGTQRATILDKVKPTQGLQLPPLFDGIAR